MLEDNSELQGLPECSIPQYHRLVEATLKLQLKSRRIAASQAWLDVGKVKDERVGEEFANMLSGDLGSLGVVGNPEELWSALKTTVLDVSGGCLGTHQKAKKNLSLKGHWIDQSQGLH